MNQNSLLRGITLFAHLFLSYAPHAAAFDAGRQTPPTTRSITNSTFDYVIVGGGLTGLVVATRLTEDPSKNVLVVENGYIERGYLADVPYATMGLNTIYMWNITSAPVEQLGNQTFFVTVGNAVGGGSQVNGMACTRGSKGDYDAWEQLGNPGWGWDGLFPYFLKSTNFTPPLPEIVDEYGVTWDESVWGEDGPVQVSHTSTFFEDTKVFRQSWINQGIPALKDGAAGDNLGLFWFPTNLDSTNGTRSFARSGYYDPAAARPNLYLLTGHKVTQVLFKEDSLEATGVEIQSGTDGSVFRVSAKNEVILAAGAIFTPHLLQRSGIGPRDILESAGVTVKKDTPAVGANLQDHPTVYMGFNVTNLTIPNPSTLATNATYNATAWEQYVTNHTGPYTGGRVSFNGNSIMFLPPSGVIESYEDLVDGIESQEALDFLPDIYAQSKPLLQGFESQRAILADLYLKNQSACCEIFPSITGGAGVSLQKPLSRGTVTLDPSNLDAPPIVRYNTLENPIDSATVLAMVRFQREHWKRPELAQYSPVESAPGAQYQTDEEILAALVSQGNLTPSLAHPSGTCAMLPEELGGCVGPDLLLYGTKKLSIIDASILPLIPGTHLQMTMYAVGEKAADIIKSRS